MRATSQCARVQCGPLRVKRVQCESVADSHSQKERDSLLTTLQVVGMQNDWLTSTFPTACASSQSLKRFVEVSMQAESCTNLLLLQGAKTQGLALLEKFKSELGQRMWLLWRSGASPAPGFFRFHVILRLE